MPGSAVIVAVVRRVTAWQGDGSARLVQRWARRVHRQGLSRAGLRRGRGGPRWGRGWPRCCASPTRSGSTPSWSPAAVWVLLCVDRGLLQAHRGYRTLAANLLVEGGMRSAAMLVLVGGRARGGGGGGRACSWPRWSPPSTPGSLADRAWADRRAGRARHPGAAGSRCSGGAGRAAFGATPSWTGPGGRAPRPAGRPRRGLRGPGHDGPPAERRRDRGRPGGAVGQRLVRRGLGGQQGARLRGHRPRRLPPARGGHPLAPGRPRPPPAGGDPAAPGGAGRRCCWRWPWPRPGCSCRWSSPPATSAPSRRFLPLVLAMVCLSVTVVLTMYLLAVGRRWITAPAGRRVPRRPPWRWSARPRRAPGHRPGRPRGPGGVGPGHGDRLRPGPPPAAAAHLRAPRRPPTRRRARRRSTIAPSDGTLGR